ncbi:MAG: class I SAM-dependent methyltransferase [Sandaracinaceae bacterium]
MSDEEFERPEKMPPLEPPVIFGQSPRPPGQADNRVLTPGDLETEALAVHNRGIAALIHQEKEQTGEQLSFVYPSKVWEYPWALSRHPLPDGELVLDAGCGVSTLPLYLAKSGATVVALDVDIRWLTMLRRAARFHTLPVVPLMGDMIGLGFPDATFDRVYCISVLEHLPVEQQPTAVREMARVLRPGGILYLTVDYDEHERRSESDVVYDRLAVQRHAIAPSGLVIEGHTRWGVDDWAAQRAAMREFKLHTFGAMGVVLRKPPGDGPESQTAIDARASRLDGFRTWSRHAVDAESVTAAAAARGDEHWIAQLGSMPDSPEAFSQLGSNAAIALPDGSHEERADAVRAIHAAAPDVPVIGFAMADAVRDGALDGLGLDAYGVEGGEGPASTVSLVRPCLLVGSEDEARDGGFAGAIDAL